MKNTNQDTSEWHSYKQGGYEYAVNEEEKIARIVKGPHIGRRRNYRIPSGVIINGERYDIDSVEIGAFRNAKCLRRLVVPDSIQFVDEYNFSSLPNLRSIYIGKGLSYLSSWTFGVTPKLRSFIIHKDNPSYCVIDGTVYTRDGKCAVTNPFRPKCIAIIEGVECVEQVAFAWNDKLENIQFPSTLKRIGDNSFADCQRLKSVTLPEGLEECVVQSFQDNEGLETADLPSTMKSYGCGTFDNCPQLSTLIIRTDYVLELKTWNHEPLGISSHCVLKVPGSLVTEYQRHPLWGKFKDIVAL